VDREYVFAVVAEERRDVANLLDQLTTTQLMTPSLCSGWDVKTVAAHLVSVIADSFWAFQWMALRRGGVHHAIDDLARRRAQCPARDIAAALRCQADYQLSPPVTGPLSGLTDVLVHGGDIKIPLGLSFAPDPQRVALALDFLTGPRPLGFVPRRRLRGIRLRGSDFGRAWGRGLEVSGPISALMMTACGRTALMGQLDGPGLPLLSQRLAGPLGGHG
jgi:uncharacterized protein (TIGR03083 family)